MPRGRRTRVRGAGNESRPALKGVRRAADVLDYLARRPGRAVDAAAGLGVSWATLHRTLSQLERDDFLQRDPDTHRYRIGPRMWLIGTSYLAHHPVLEAAQSYLQVEVEGVDLAVQLVERIGRQAVTLYAQQGSGETITKTTYGYHFPLHCGAKGQVLLAYAGADFIDDYLAAPLQSLTPETVTDPATLRRMLALIRQQGWARTEGDVQAFTGSLAAPVFNRRGEAVAALALITHRSSLRDAGTGERMLETLLRMAQSISIALGWRPGGLEAERRHAHQRRSP